MFKIDRLRMASDKGEIFDYEFKSGINYFKGKNSSGKTEFYNFIDYMFGSSEEINKKPWYKDSLSYAILEFEYMNIQYEIKRTLDKEKNFFRYKDENFGDTISSEEYKNKLNSIFSSNISNPEEIREFTNEALTFRTFTLFSFLGEKSLGTIKDFFSKGKEIKYSVKLTPILNYIFNNNLQTISRLKKELLELQTDVYTIESTINKFNFINENINMNLKKLNIHTLYDGKNKDKVIKELEIIKSLEETKPSKNKTISELEVIYNNINEQIKTYKNSIRDSQNFKNENENREKLLKEFSLLVDKKSEFKYLVEPLSHMVSDLEKSISFNKYINDQNTIKELIKQRDKVKKEILSNESRFICYSVTENSRFIALIEEYLKIDTSYDKKELDKKKSKIKSLKNSIKELQNSDDDKKINELSDFITLLYKSAKDISSVVGNDDNIKGFHIQYYKKGNLLQPIINEVSEDGNKKEAYYTGSMARHTLIQFAGYLAFLKMLIKENKYPLIPILVIDHISKPFDKSNKKAIGIILKEFYKHVDFEDLQTFIFDDENSEDLLVEPNNYENLVTKNKSGFNPFYKI